jgi:adhesin transport system outer membrane protein
MHRINHCRVALQLASATAIAAWAWTPAKAVDLKEAVAVAVTSSPEVNTAAQDKQAIEFERKQAQGLWLPRVDLEAQGGVEDLNNPTRRDLGIATHSLYPAEGGISATETLLDAGYRKSELHRQAARTDSAAHHVEERAEFIGLDVVHNYLDYLLQQRLYALAQDNIAFHEKMVTDLQEGVRSGSISIADQQQAEERAAAAKAQRIQAQEAMLQAGIAFQSRTGLPMDNPTMPGPIAGKVPATLDDAVSQARTHNPRVRFAMADVDAATANVKEAQSALWPKVTLEASARGGRDVDGFEGRTTDAQARVVMRWNIYSGGVTQANIQEQIRRDSEQLFILHEVVREVNDDVQEAWNRRDQQQALLAQLEKQSKISDDLVNSYREQFKVGRRSLLDLLDSQNSRYNTKAQAETARFAELFAEYKILAATGELLDALGIPHPADTNADARKTYRVPEAPPSELQERHEPGR